MDKFFLKFFLPHLCMFSASWGSLRYVCWVPTDPPLGTPAADRPTRLPPPPPDPQTFSHSVGV